MCGFAICVPSKVMIMRLHLVNSPCKSVNRQCCCYSLGHIDRREGFHTAVQLWPSGYEATWPESQLEGASYISLIQPDEDAEGPSFSVTLRTADGQEQVLLPEQLLYFEPPALCMLIRPDIHITL